jgi:hypothetical protein
MTLARGDLKAALPRPHQLTRVTPSAGAHRVAVRAAISIALPLMVVWLTGHIAWSMYAAFGAFASLYGRDAAYGARLRMQLQAGTALVLGVTAGAAIGCSPDRRWLAVPVVAACAFLVSLLADRLRWHPAGPLFVVFGAAAVGAHAATPGQVPLAFAVAAAAALFAVAVGTAGRLLKLPGSATSRSANFTAAPPAGPYPGWLWTQAGRYGVAVLAAGAAATAIGIGHPYWSMVAAVVAVTGADTTARLTRAIHRVAGTLAGVGLGAAILAPHLPVGALIVIVGLLQFATELVVGRNYGLAVVCLTPLALTMGTLAQPASTWPLLDDRAIETVLGAVIGMAVSLAAHYAHAYRAVPAAG